VSYKPERKFISEIKGLVNTEWYESGGRWFDGVEPNAVHTATSFEILRNDFTLIGSGYNLRLSEAGTYRIQYQCILDLNDTTNPAALRIRTWGGTSSNGYTPTISNGYQYYLQTYTGMTRAYTDTTVNGVTCRSASLDVTVDYDPTVGSSNQLGADYLIQTPSYHSAVDEWIYQRIEVTKL
jgi:hypothetical protein